MWIPYSTFAQKWQQVGTDRFGVKWLNDHTILTVGGYGIVMSSQDAGKTWVYSSMPTRETLLDIHCFDELHCIAVGSSGSCLLSSDGGVSWSNISMPTSQTLSAIDFPTRSKGWAVGEDGAILNTTDGGMNWTIMTSGSSSYLFDVKFFDSLTGLAVGEKGVILRTENGGRSWEKLLTNVLNSYTGIDCKGDTGIIVQYEAAPLYSSDRGKTWNLTETTGGNTDLEAVRFLGNGRVIAVGNLPRLTDTFGVRIIISTDGGKRWQGIQTGLPASWYPLNALDINSRGEIVVVGEHGSIANSPDNGKTWKVSTYSRLRDYSNAPDYNVRLYSAFSFSPSIGVIVGGPALGPGIALQTTDNGLTWQTSSTPLPINSLGIAQGGEVVGMPENQQFHGGMFITSSDQGKSWNTKHPEFFGKEYNQGVSLQFLNSNDGYFAADSLVFYTNNGGNSWQWIEVPAYRGNISELSVIDHQDFWVSVTAIPEGPHLLDSTFVNRLYRTTDGGLEWKQLRESYGRPYRTYGNFYFHNRSEGWMSYGLGGWSAQASYILHTSNGGETWDSVEVPGTVNSIHFFSDSLGYAVGGNALIMKTTDRGKTWNREYPWPYQASDTSMVFIGSTLLPGSRTMIVFGNGILVRGEFATPVTSVPNEGEHNGGNNADVRVVPTISTNDRRRVEVPGSTVIRSIILRDILGRMVQTIPIENVGWSGEYQTLELNVADVAAGVYEVVVSSDNTQSVGRLVVVK